MGLPVVAILQNVSTNGRYIGLCLLVWTFPMSTMGLIMGPKMFVVRRERLGLSSPEKRGSRVPGTRVSGLDSVPSSRVSQGCHALSSPGGVKPPLVQTVILE